VVIRQVLQAVSTQHEVEDACRTKAREILTQNDTNILRHITNRLVGAVAGDICYGHDEPPEYRVRRDPEAAEQVLQSLLPEGAVVLEKMVSKVNYDLIVTFYLDADKVQAVLTEGSGVVGGVPGAVEEEK
jgi:hypothetical protein